MDHFRLTSRQCSKLLAVLMAKGHIGCCVTLASALPSPWIAWLAIAQKDWHTHLAKDRIHRYVLHTCQTQSFEAETRKISKIESRQSSKKRKKTAIHSPCKNLPAWPSQQHAAHLPEADSALSVVLRWYHANQYPWTRHTGLICEGTESLKSSIQAAMQPALSSQPHQKDPAPHGSRVYLQNNQSSKQPSMKFFTSKKMQHFIEALKIWSVIRAR